MKVHLIREKSVTRLIWFRGEIVPLEKATINILSPTSQFGANVFEGLRGYWCSITEQLYVFRLDDHIKRLNNSIKMMQFECQYTESELKQGVLDIIRANDFREDIVIRQTVFLDGFGSWASKGPTDMFIAPMAKARALGEDKEGFRCCVSSWERINDNSMSPRIKVGANNINSRMGQIEAVNNGFDSTIFLNSRGTVSEGPGSCLFMIRDGVIITPPLSASVLESITRFTVIEIARAILGLEVVEREVDRTELYIADEIFFSGTAVEIIPVLSVDHYEISSKVGYLTKKIKEKYFDIVRGKEQNYSDWLTKVY
jgi:branched-chain amino acid aminotransferase